MPAAVAAAAAAAAATIACRMASSTADLVCVVFWVGVYRRGWRMQGPCPALQEAILFAARNP